MVTSKKPAVKKPSASARKDGYTKVFWTEPEHGQMAQAAALAVRNGFKGRMRALLISVQPVLPEARRRTSFSMTDEPWFQPALDKAMADLHQAEVDEAARAAAAAQPQEPAPVVAAPTPAPEPNGHAVAPVEAVAAGIGHAMLNLRSMLVDELAAVFVEAALKAMGSGLLGAPPLAEIAPSHAGNGAGRIVFHQEPRKRSVLVAGLKGLQHLDIEKRFARQFDLRFVSADESKDKLRTESDRSEIAIVMKDHVASSQADIVKARTRHYIEQPGGVRQLQETLTGMLQ